MTYTHKIEPKIAFCCTSIFPNSTALAANVYNWPNDRIFIALDLKSSKTSDFVHNQISVNRPPKSLYEELCPKNSYSRKNIAFIEAYRGGADYIYETDDDNEIENWDGLKDPASHFGYFQGKTISRSQNLFSKIYLLNDNIWARGYPLRLLDDNSVHKEVTDARNQVGVVQFLVNGNPDVDAIFRLVKGNNVDYEIDERSLPIATAGAYHPFNSQSTLWPRPHFSLMYLPSTCSFRMTDIYRSYVAQHILYSRKYCVKYCPANVFQKRNEHRISSDFFQEYKGYAETESIIEKLYNTDVSDLNLREAMNACYIALTEIGVVEADELSLMREYLNAIS